MLGFPWRTPLEQIDRRQIPGHLDGPTDQHPRRAHAQPQEHRPRHPAQQAGGDHRPVGLGQVLARLRHAVCGRPAPLRGEPVGLCAAVPAADGQARRRHDRGPVARDLHRAEGHQPQPALHRGHGDRDPRLPAPAVRPRRHALLPRPRPAAAGADGVADGRCGAGLAGRAAPDDPGAGGARDARASSSSCSPRCRRRATCASASTARPTSTTTCPSSRRPRSTTSTSSSTGCKVRARHAAAPGGELRGRAAAGRRPRDRAWRWTSGARNTCSTPSSPARSATTRSPNSSRASSRSTRRWAPARAATASATCEFFDPARVVAFPTLSLASGAIKGWDRRNGYYFSLLESLAQALQVRRRHALRGASRPPCSRRCCTAPARKRSASATRWNRATRPARKLTQEASLRRRSSPTWRGAIARPIRWRCARSWRAIATCSPAPTATARACAARRATCQGGRRRPGPRASTRSATPRCARASSTSTDLKLHGAKAEIADKVVREIGLRLKFLNDVGLNYLSLDRSAETLSGGEAQRIRLASQIGSGLTGVMYVLDEPSIGLHQRDNDRLIGTLQPSARHRQQRDRGRARRGHDPRRRPRHRHGPGRRRPRRPRDGAGHASRT